MKKFDLLNLPFGLTECPDRFDDLADVVFNAIPAFSVFSNEASNLISELQAKGFNFESMAARITTECFINGLAQSVLIHARGLIEQYPSEYSRALDQDILQAVYLRAFDLLYYSFCECPNGDKNATRVEDLINEGPYREVHYRYVRGVVFDDQLQLLNDLLTVQGYSSDMRYLYDCDFDVYFTEAIEGE